MRTAVWALNCLSTFLKADQPYFHWLCQQEVSIGSSMQAWLLFVLKNASWCLVWSIFLLWRVFVHAYALQCNAIPFIIVNGLFLARMKSSEMLLPGRSFLLRNALRDILEFFSNNIWKDVILRVESVGQASNAGLFHTKDHKNEF